MIRFLRAMVFCAVFIGISSHLVSAQIPADSVIERIIRERVEAGRSTGIIVGVIDSDGEQRVVAWPEQVSGVPLDRRAEFEIGSIAKVFTAALLADMVKRGEVSLDDPVADYLPTGVRMPVRGERPITLIDLATHVSGLPSTPTNLDPVDPTDPFVDYAVEDLYAFLDTYSLTRDVGAEWSYANTGAALLGHALARRAGMDYRSLLTERILTPLSLGTTKVSGDAITSEHFVQGHDVSGNITPQWHLGVFTPAGGLTSTVDDLLRFLQANLDPDDSVLGRVLESTHSVRHVIGPQASMGLGWIRYTERGDSVVWHPGETGGYHAFIGFNPSNDTGVVVLSSSRTTIDDIGIHLLLPDSPLEDPLSHIVGRNEVSLNEEELKRYLGEYRFLSGESLTVRHSEGKLFGFTKWARFQLHPEAPGEFFVYDFPGEIDFDIGSDGLVSGLTRTMQGQAQRASKVQ